MIRRLLALALLVAVTGTAHAQGVLVAPTTIVIDGRERAASVLLVNPNDAAVEVELSTLYGYTVTDSAGNFSLWTTETPDAAAPSAVEWIRVFPRRVSIAPRAQQLVRLLVSPPAGLADGEYWARLVVLARGVPLPVTAPVDSGSVTVGLTVEVRTVLPILYRKGAVAAGGAVEAVAAVRHGDSVAVHARVGRLGQGAVLGSVRASLLDAQGAVRDTATLPVAVYETIEPRLVLHADPADPGPHRVRLELVSERADLPPEAILRFPASRDSVGVTLP